MGLEGLGSLEIQRRRRSLQWYEAHTRLAGVAFLFIGLFFLIALFLLH